MVVPKVGIRNMRRYCQRTTLGRKPQKGGLLYAKYGKAVYICDAYAFYRQLPEGVTGAYRIFANMISLPKNPRIR